MVRGVVANGPASLCSSGTFLVSLAHSFSRFLYFSLYRTTLYEASSAVRSAGALAGLNEEKREKGDEGHFSILENEGTEKGNRLFLF